MLRNGALEKSFLGASAPFGATFFGPGGVLIGPNNSGTAVSAHSSTTVSLSCSTANMCNNSATSAAGELNWNLAGPVFPSVGAQKINGTIYAGQICAPTGVGTGPCAVAAVDPNFLDPYSIQWNLDIQRAITNNLTLDVAYVGNHGADEMAQIDLNQPPLGTGYTPAVIAKLHHSRHPHQLHAQYRR